MDNYLPGQLSMALVVKKKKFKNHMYFSSNKSLEGRKERMKGTPICLGSYLEIPFISLSSLTYVESSTIHSIS